MPLQGFLFDIIFLEFPHIFFLIRIKYRILVYWEKFNEYILF